MIFYPKSYFKNITEINADFFQEKHIKAVLLDIDNTLIDKNNNMVKGLEDWIENVDNGEGTRTRAERLEAALMTVDTPEAKANVKVDFNN